MKIQNYKACEERKWGCKDHEKQNIRRGNRRK